MEPTKARSANGQFPNGFSGNPGGRPRDEQKVAELACSYTREAIETLVELMLRGNAERVTVIKARRPLPVISGVECRRKSAGARSQSKHMTSVTSPDTLAAAVSEQYRRGYYPRFFFRSLVQR